MFINKGAKQLTAALLALLALLLVQPCQGQNFSATYTSLKEKYPQEQAVYWKYYEDLDISLQGDSLWVQAANYREMVHLGEMSNIFAKDVVYTSYFYKVDNIEAATLLPNKKKFKKIKVTDFKETFDKNSQVFFDDTRLITFVYPAIEPGAHTVLSYNESIKDARFISSFFFKSHLPMVHGRFTLTLDPGIEVDLKLMHDTQQVKVRKEQAGNRVKWIYEVFDSEKIKSESNSPNIKYHTPHLTIVVRAYKNTKGKEVKVLSSANDLYSWYRTFIKGLEDYQDEQVKTIVASLVKDARTEEEKVKRIFYWVQENIKYIAFEDGMRGLIPHNGAYVFEKRFGDCKDMASILVNMMQHAGIKGYFTWIGTRDIPYSYSELPSPLVDNHMIATYISNGR
ncbi:MAG: transglutaminase-like domain-containing protein, partial [Bacteroidetes bacterium]|nr:transglutaminase-like domain-containing protein [Bacteroidota bacterium]